MHVHRSGSAVEISTPAKLNLFLEVQSRRGDGYHEIESLMVPVALWDTITFEASAAEQITLTCRGDWGARVAPQAPPHPQSPRGGEALPPDEQNIALRAVRLLKSRSGHAGGGRLDLVKRIPIAAGLGGGSSDAAAALVAANLAWGLGWSTPKLAELGAELGSDVPFFLASAPAVCRGRGQRVEALPHRNVLHCVVVQPPEGLSTALVYSGCQPAVAPHPLGRLVEALRSGCIARAARLLYNGLQWAASQRSPWIERLRDEFSRLEFLGHQMSGSGTSYFGICQHARHARRLAACLQQRGIGRALAVAASC